jgi:hypothetical protein
MSDTSLIQNSLFRSLTEFGQGWGPKSRFRRGSIVSTSISPSRSAPADGAAAGSDDLAEAPLPLHPWFWFGLGLVVAILVAALILWIDTANDDAHAATGVTAAGPAAR